MPGSERRAWDKASEGGVEPELRDDPVPLFTDEEPAPYPIEALPEIMGAAVRSYQAFGRQPIELIACSAVSAAALCCQGLADVDRDGNLIGPCSLSFLIIAVSGERKTTVDKRLRRAIRHWQQCERAQREPDITIGEVSGRYLAQPQRRHPAEDQTPRRLARPRRQGRIRSARGGAEAAGERAGGAARSNPVP